jgi:hypothetical protein
VEVEEVDADQRDEDRVLPVGVLAVEGVGLSPEADEVETEEGAEQRGDGDDLDPRGEAQAEDFVAAGRVVVAEVAGR